MAIDDYKVQHLFLLVGENPLPNYVAAKLLLTSEGERTLYLVHTSGTLEAAKRLGNILEPELPGVEIERVSIGYSESDAFEIREEISEVLEDIEEGTIGLNYTGGTKAMSVHSYRALFYQEDKDKSQYTKRPNIVFSYLDARRLEMCFDRENGKRDSYKVTPEMLQVDLETIFKLHGWQWREKTTPTYQPKLLEATKVFLQLYQETTWAMAWQNWCKEVFKDEKGNRKKDKNINILEPLKVEISQGFDAIKNTLNLDKEDPQNFLETIKNKGQFKNIRELGKWLDGEWLEHYVLQQVIDISEEMSIHDKGTSFYIYTNQDLKDNKFEFDVAFMRGYQLFAISCTTDSSSLCKSKLFEAYIRAQQLGGSEARVALVCGADANKVERLKTEITNVFNPEPESPKKDHRLKVFGREDWMDLSALIKQWIKDVDKEAE